MASSTIDFNSQTRGKEREDSISDNHGEKSTVPSQNGNAHHTLPEAQLVEMTDYLIKQRPAADLVNELVVESLQLLASLGRG